MQQLSEYSISQHREREHDLLKKRLNIVLEESKNPIKSVNTSDGLDVQLIKEIDLIVSQSVTDEW